MKIKKIHLKFILVCLIASIPLAIQGGFADSDVYYEQAIYTWTNGLLGGGWGVFQQTGKLEFGMQFLFYIEGLVCQDKTFFLIANFILVNLCLYSLLLKCSEISTVKVTSVTIFILIFTYYTYSNTLYVWRTVFALYFFFTCIHAKMVKDKFIFFVLSVTFHYTALLFYVAYYVAKYLPDKKTSSIFYVVVGTVSGYLCIAYLPFIKYFVSGGNSDIFLEAQGEYLKRFIINVSFLFILFSSYINSYDVKKKNLFKMCILLCSLSVAFSMNWQLSWRLFAPAALLGVPLILSSNYKNIPYYMMFLSVFPTLKLMGLLIQGISP